VGALPGAAADGPAGRDVTGGPAAAARANEGPRKDATNTVPPLEIYKRGQGKYTRITTFLGVMLLVVIGAVRLSEELTTVALSPLVRYGIATALVVVSAAVMFWVVNRPRSADFMIATEGEMKKVSWSSRKEVIGSTKVVIITTLILTVILFTVDLLFTQLFVWIKVLG
jgi:preprotein translocase subunit SecE